MDTNEIEKRHEELFKACYEAGDREPPLGSLPYMKEAYRNYCEKRRAEEDDE